MKDDKIYSKWITMGTMISDLPDIQQKHNIDMIDMMNLIESVKNDAYRKSGWDLGRLSFGYNSVKVPAEPAKPDFIKEDEFKI